MHFATFDFPTSYFVIMLSSNVDYNNGSHIDVVVVVVCGIFLYFFSILYRSFYLIWFGSVQFSVDCVFFLFLRRSHTKTTLSLVRAHRQCYALRNYRQNNKKTWKSLAHKACDY